MANVYPEPNKDKPAKKSDDQTSQKTVGVYGRPKRKGPSTVLIITIVLAIIVLAWILMSGFTGTAHASPAGMEVRSPVEFVLDMEGILP